MSDKGHNNIDRRRFFQQGLAAVGAASVAGAVASLAPGQEESSRSIRIGVIGVGPRGKWHITNLLTNYPDVTVTAICDIQEDRLKMAIEMVKKMRGTTPVGYSKGEYDYRNMCQRDDVDAVLIATPVYWLGRMTVDALHAGKHAALEVPGAQTEEECWNMVTEKKKTGKHVMFLEECCYGNDNLMIYSMVKQGVFGEPYYAEGSYVHDCRAEFFDSSGKILWRGELGRDSYGTSYPQHGFASNSKWLEINDGDRLEYCQTMMTSPREAHLGAVRQYGPGSEPAKVHFKEGDFVTTLISTAKGRMIRIDYSICCTRPYSRYYLLQGTKGCWDSRSGVFLLRDDVPYTGRITAPWEPLQTYQQKYQHPYWRESSVAAKRAGGHGGMDYFCIRDFLKMVREDREPWIDVYDAATWSSIIFCSKLSLDRNGARVEMPDFTDGKWKDPNWRKDRMPIS
jgi:predicted dehydrogenase